MKYLFILFATQIAISPVQGQIPYDSITISRFLIEEENYGARWPDTLKAGHFANYISEERTVWTKPLKVPKVLPGIINLVNRVKINGTADVSKCFIPRHSINYYRAGKIAKYLLICFECDGVRFSDDPKNTYVKSIGTREKQMAELKIIFTELAVDPLPIRSLFFR